MVISHGLSIRYIFAIRKISDTVGVGTVDNSMSIADDKLGTCSGDQLLAWFYSDNRYLVT